MNQYPSYRRLLSVIGCLASSAILSIGSTQCALAGSLFPGSGGGPIPDGTGASVTTTFNVTGMVGQISTVGVNLDITHSWAGDLTATLIAPNDLASLKLFGRIGSGRLSAFGDSSNLSGVYSFDDAIGQDLWAAAAAVTDLVNIPNESFRTSTAGTGNITAAQRTNVGGCSTFLQLAFRGLRADQMNGQWRLVISDAVSGDVGTTNAAATSLFIETEAVPDLSIFRSSFELGESSTTPGPIPPVVASSAIGTCTPGINSPTGSGLTDFVTVRANAAIIEWRVKKNDATGAGAEDAPFVLGKDTDFFSMGDFDGDGASDATIWSPGTPGRFKVRRSSRPNDVPLELLFGLNGDVPDVIADFDGDRITDFAVYRDGTAGDTTAHFLIRRSSSGVTTDFPITNSDGGVAFPIRDINSNGRADFGVQFNGGGGVGSFRMFTGTNGASLGTFNFGLASDFVVPGQFVGDSVTDLAVSRNANPGSGTVKYAFPRDMATGAGDATTLATGIVFGISGDFISQGDYDGDGIVDFAVWRSSATPGQSKFILRRSTNPGTPLDVFMGQSGDYPVNNWDVH